MTTGEEIIDFRDRGLVFVLPDSAALARRAANLFASATQEAVLGRGRAYIALSGGSTPKAMGQVLVTPEFQRRITWPYVEIFWDDERWVPLDSEESNAGVAKRGFLDQTPIPEKNVHAYDTNAEDPKLAAAEMEAKVRAVLPEDEFPPRFDLILLGMGDDGHTASLFPGTPAIRENSKLVLSHHVPKLDTERLTFSPPLINAARQVVFLVSGAGKAPVLRKVLEGDYQPELLPSQVVRPTNGRLVWLVDAAAAADLSRSATF